VISEDLRLQLLQAVVDAFEFQDGKIVILVKSGKWHRVSFDTGYNANEPEKIKAIRFAPRKDGPPASGVVV